MTHFELDDSISAWDEQRSLKTMVRECVEAFLQRLDVKEQIWEWQQEWRASQDKRFAVFSEMTFEKENNGSEK